MAEPGGVHTTASCILLSCLCFLSTLASLAAFHYVYIPPLMTSIGFSIHNALWDVHPDHFCIFHQWVCVIDGLLTGSVKQKLLSKLKNNNKKENLEDLLPERQKQTHY